MRFAIVFGLTAFSVGKVVMSGEEVEEEEKKESNNPTLKGRELRENVFCCGVLLSPQYALHKSERTVVGRWNAVSIFLYSWILFWHFSANKWP